jgi:2-hydroxychromene-2-carboxylate isomerase
MKACNNIPPIQITNKGAWINVERQRWAALFNIPMKETLPPKFPLFTLSAMRVLTALSMGSHSCCVYKAGLALFQASWVQHLDISDPKVILGVLAREEVLGEGVAKEVMGEIGEKRVKDRLVENTQECFGVGGFGLPWFEVMNGEGVKRGFWGFDHLGQVADFLGLEKPRSGGWKAVL